MFSLLQSNLNNTICDTLGVSGSNKSDVSIVYLSKKTRLLTKKSVHKEMCCQATAKQFILIPHKSFYHFRLKVSNLKHKL